MPHGATWGDGEQPEVAEGRLYSDGGRGCPLVPMEEVIVLSK